MRAPTVNQLFGAWEQGLSQSPIQRSLTLLSLLDDETPPAQLTELSLGQRDGKLLALREKTFGQRMIGYAACPACVLRLELNFDVCDLAMNPIAEVAEPLALREADYEVRFRLLNSSDLATADYTDLAAGRLSLLKGCVLSATRQGQDVPVEGLPDAVTSLLASRIADADPQSDVDLSLTCPRCEHHWQTPFDIGSFLWAEIHAWACRLLREIHALASAYGWREADILALSPWRRQAYLELVEQ